MRLWAEEVSAGRCSHCLTCRAVRLQVSTESTGEGHVNTGVTHFLATQQK